MQTQAPLRRGRQKRDESPRMGTGLETPWHVPLFEPARNNFQQQKRRTRGAPPKSATGRYRLLLCILPYRSRTGRPFQPATRLFGPALQFVLQLLLLLFEHFGIGRWAVI